jgi:hypothetical protein
MSPVRYTTYKLEMLYCQSEIGGQSPHRPGKRAQEKPRRTFPWAPPQKRQKKFGLVLQPIHLKIVVNVKLVGNTLRTELHDKQDAVFDRKRRGVV